MSDSDRVLCQWPEIYKKALENIQPDEEGPLLRLAIERTMFDHEDDSANQNSEWASNEFHSQAKKCLEFLRASKTLKGVTIEYSRSLKKIHFSSGWAARKGFLGETHEFLLDLKLPPVVHEYFGRLHIEFNQKEYNFTIEKSEVKMERLIVKNTKTPTFFSVKYLKNIKLEYPITHEFLTITKMTISMDVDKKPLSIHINKFPESYANKLQISQVPHKFDFSLRCDDTCYVLEYFPISFKIDHSENVEIEQMKLGINFTDTQGQDVKNLVKIFDSTVTNLILKDSPEVSVYKKGFPSNIFG